MRMPLLFLLAIAACTEAYPQAVTFPVPPPPKEEFVNAIYHTLVDSSFTAYYLCARADTCRFVKYNYEDWAQYVLKEPVSIVILNELAGKVYYSKNPYFWKQDQLQRAICINNRQADSILDYASDIPNARYLSKQQLATARRISRERWDHLPAEKKMVFSFSQPQFTDDGQYAVIDLNFTCGTACGEGYTCLFRLTSAGWKLIAKYNNWSA